MDQELVKKYYDIPTINGYWECPQCKIKLKIGRSRLKKTQIRQHLSTFLHTRNAKYEEKTRSRIEELEEMIDTLVDEYDDE